MTRPPAKTLVGDGTMTSENIRALARAGYRRTDISTLLGVRYQYVRQVLVYARITDGLQRRGGSRVTPCTLTKARAKPLTSTDLLLRAGFKPLDHAGDSTRLELSCTLYAEAGLYAFLIDGQVRYVGLVGRSPRWRVDHHRRRSVQARTHGRVKAMFQAAVATRKLVAVLMATDEPQAKDGLPAKGAAGLEAGLILLVRPRWTLGGAL